MRVLNSISSAGGVACNPSCPAGTKPTAQRHGFYLSRGKGFKRANVGVRREHILDPARPLSPGTQAFGPIVVGTLGDKTNQQSPAWFEATVHLGHQVSSFGPSQPFHAEEAGESVEVFFGGRELLARRVQDVLLCRGFDPAGAPGGDFFRTLKNRPLDPSVLAPEAVRENARARQYIEPLVCFGPALDGGQ